MLRALFVCPWGLVVACCVAWGQVGTETDATSPGGRFSSRPASDELQQLPREAKQTYREYDISAFTSRLKDAEHPEQSVVDWVLRKTGPEVWFTEPFGFMNANKQKLRVYHTPEMHEVVSEVVERFVNSHAESHLFGLRLVTIGSPNWRSASNHLLRPVNVQSPGVHAWLLTKENAAMLLAQLSKRSDYREHSSPNLILHNGQTQVLAKQRPRTYVRSLRLKENSFPGHELDMGQIQEGYSLAISPLVTQDGKIIEASVKCDIDQIERFLNVPIDVPLTPGQMQRVQIQVPQLVSWRLNELFRWETDKILLLSCGVVATPNQDRGNLMGIPGLPNPMPSSAGRADALLLIEAKGQAGSAVGETDRSATLPNYRGRY